MKHIIALTTLAAAASAQTAPASGLGYNNITLSRTSRQNALSLQMALGQSNFVAGFATSNDYLSDSSSGQVAIGYVFKGVTQGIDATVGIIQSNYEASVYTIELRRQLNEVYQGLEIAAGYAGSLSANTYGDFVFGGVGVDSAEWASYVGLVYNINKTFSVGVSLNKQGALSYGYEYNRQTVYSVRASF